MHQISLPEPERRRGLAGLLFSRRSTKHFDAARVLDVEEVSTILWAAAGLTSSTRRVSPSALATHPIAVTLIAGAVSGLDSGSYLYDPLDHAVAPGPAGDHRGGVAAGTLDARDWLDKCSALLLLSADLGAAQLRFSDQPADHGPRFVWIETGHAAQNVYLQAAELGIDTCLVAGLDDTAIANACRPLVPAEHHVLGILGLGRSGT